LYEYNASKLKQLNPLCSWERSRTMEWGSYGEPQFRKLLDGELKASAKNLILALYMIWPVSVESAIPVVDRKDILTVDIPFDINRSYVHECMLEQVRHFVSE
jgi:hypothetical protein